MRQKENVLMLKGLREFVFNLRIKVIDFSSNKVKTKQQFPFHFSFLALFRFI